MSQGMIQRRRGFTLVELLVSIAIIGSLMAMTSVAIWRAIQTARSAAISVELNNLAQAMQSYKESQIQQPPSMANVSVTDRKMAFMRHVQLAFANANTYTASVTGYAGIRNKVMLTATPTNFNYNYAVEGAVRQLDLDTLDQAEALVFWLGGFPTPVNPSTKQPIASSKLFGFHVDSDNPFRRDPSNLEASEPLRFRTKPLYEFDQTRLVDNDGDGWLEYVPLRPRSGANTAPFVYFDSTTYSSSVDSSKWRHMAYPRIDNNGVVSPTAATLASQWGTAAPMAMYFDPGGASPTRWSNENSFQIICGGLDNAYSDPVTSLTNGQRIPIFPSGFVYSGSNEQGYYSKPEYDNLTNLSNKTLEGARSEAQQ